MVSTGGLIEILGTRQTDRTADILFVHGLSGDPMSTWQVDGDPNRFWPKWLGEDLPSVGVWSFGYEAAPLKFVGHSMSIRDRATNMLAQLEARELGKKPIIFICHSLGGLLAKQLIRNCAEYTNEYSSLLLNNTKGIVFLATPHSGSAAATWSSRILKLLSRPLLNELRADNKQLLELNTWYRMNVSRLGIMNQAYSETKAVMGALIVDDVSADPHLPDLIPIPVDADHVSISKIDTRDNFIYIRVRAFVVHMVQRALDESQLLEKDGLPQREFSVIQEPLPFIYGTEPAKKAISVLPEARLRRLLTDRLRREEIAVIWFETFGDGMNDHLPGKSIGECVIELIVRAKKSSRFPQLYEAVALQIPNVENELP